MNNKTTGADLAYRLNGETRYYNDAWEKIEDEHYPECPTSIAAGQKRISTLCLCAELKKAEDAINEPDECLRCHQFVNGCKCGAKAQWI